LYSVLVVVVLVIAPALSYCVAVSSLVDMTSFSLLPELPPDDDEPTDAADGGGLSSPSLLEQEKAKLRFGIGF